MAYAVEGPAANLTRIGPTLYFTAADAVTGNELWKTDGTPAGTILVKDVTPGAAGTTFRKLTPGRTRLYFTVRTDSDSVYQLWTSDGTAEGTAIVSPNVSAVVSDDPYRPIQPLAIGDTLYFRGWVRGGPTGAELWRTDGTPVGTSLVKDVWPGPGDSAPFALTNVGGTLYFVAWEPASKHALWKSDGTELGTVLVADVYDGVNNPPIGNLTPVGNALYFTADDRQSDIKVMEVKGGSP